MPQQISIQEVINRLRSSSDSCTLKVVRSSGKKKGELITIAQARYGAPRQRVPQGSSGGRRASTRPNQHKDQGTLPITDLGDRGRYKSILISHIVGYNQFTVVH